MKDLKIYYKYNERINSEFDKEIEKIAEKFGLKFIASGFDYENKIRDIHYVEKKKRGEATVS